LDVAREHHCSGGMHPASLEFAELEFDAGLFEDAVNEFFGLHGFAGPEGLPLLLIPYSLSSVLPGRNPLVGDILFGSVAHYPGQGHLFLFGQLVKRFVEIGRKSDRRPNGGRVLNLHSLPPPLLHRGLPLFSRDHHTTPRR
jgi:hypothetical protein